MRPALIVSYNLLNEGSSGLVIVVPITSKEKGIPSHIRIEPEEGGVKVVSYALCEQVRSISKERLVKKLGKIRAFSVLKEVNSWITDLIWLE